MLFLLLDPVLLSLTCGVLGLIIGSFLNVVIVRLPRMMESQWHIDCCELMDQPIPADTPLSLAHPRSTCPQCGAGIRAWHNIPLLSWLVLR